MAKKTTCPISRAQFRQGAKPVEITIGDQRMVVPVKFFSTGSLGWYLNGKTSIEVGGQMVAEGEAVGGHPMVGEGEGGGEIDRPVFRSAIDAGLEGITLAAAKPLRQAPIGPAAGEREVAFGEGPRRRVSGRRYWWRFSWCCDRPRLSGRVR